MAKRLLATVVLIMLVSGLMACSGAGGNGKAASSQVSVGQEATAEVAADAVDAGQQGDVLEATPTLPPAPAEPTPTSPPSAPEVSALDGVLGLDRFSSFQANLALEFEGARGASTGEALTNQRQTYMLEVTRDPQARHQITTIKSEGGIDVEAETEAYLVDGVTYTKAFGTWTAQPGLMGLSQFANPAQFVYVPETAACAAGTETVNGVAATRCSFTEADNISDALDAGSIAGAVWLAEDGGYVVKYELEARDLQLKGRFEGFAEMALYKISYDLTAADSGLSISLPAEAAGTQPIDIAGIGAGQPSGFAAPAGAEIIFDDLASLIYFIRSDPATIADFHRQSLTAAGWQEVAGEGYLEDHGALITFENDSGILRVFVFEDIDGGFFVTITPPFEAPEMGTVSQGAASSDYPVLADAENVMSAAGATTYYTASDIPAILEFYRQQLAELGWTENADAGFSDDTSALLQFSKDDQMLMVTARAEGDGRVNVAIINTTP